MLDKLADPSRLGFVSTFVKFDTFLYRHFKNNGHLPSKIVIQPVEKIIYDPNSSTRLKNIKRHETELKWIKLATLLSSLIARRWVGLQTL